MSLILTSDWLQCLTVYKTSCATEDAAVCLTVPETTCEQAVKEIKRQVCSPVQKEHCITVRSLSRK